MCVQAFEYIWKDVKKEKRISKKIGMENICNETYTTCVICLYHFESHHEKLFERKI